MLDAIHKVRHAQGVVVVCGGGRGCPGNCYGALRHGGGCVLAIVTFVIKKIILDRVAVRLIPQIVMPCLWYIATEFERKRKRTKLGEK